MTFDRPSNGEQKIETKPLKIINELPDELVTNSHRGKHSRNLSTSSLKTKNVF